MSAVTQTWKYLIIELHVSLNEEKEEDPKIIEGRRTDAEDEGPPF